LEHLDGHSGTEAEFFQTMNVIDLADQLLDQSTLPSYQKV